MLGSRGGSGGTAALGAWFTAQQAPGRGQAAFHTSKDMLRGGERRQLRTHALNGFGLALTASTSVAQLQPLIKAERPVHPRARTPLLLPAPLRAPGACAP